MNWMKLRQAIAGASIVAAIATMTASLASAGAPSIDFRNLVGHPDLVNELVDDGWKDNGVGPTTESGPTENGSIIVECVAFSGTSPAAGAGVIAAVRPASVPHYGLGPSRCPPAEFRRVQ